jgi:hypothetical protein
MRLKEAKVRQLEYECLNEGDRLLSKLLPDISCQEINDN